MTIHIGEGSGGGSVRVGSDFLSEFAGRVRSRFAGSDRVGSKKSGPWTTLNTPPESVHAKFIISLCM